jgi:hypothetical protein
MLDVFAYNSIDVKYEQMKYFVHCIEKFNTNRHPVIVTGDLNSKVHCLLTVGITNYFKPDSAVYQLLSTGFVDVNHPDFKPLLLRSTTLAEFLPVEEKLQDLSISESNAPKQEATAEITKEQKLEQVHSMALQSAYAHYQNNQEPPYTNYQRDFQGTLDYIFYDVQQLELVGVQEVMTNNVLHC